MFDTLPETIQQQILRLLEADNFCAARDLRDAFMRQQAEGHILSRAVLVSTNDVNILESNVAS